MRFWILNGPNLNLLGAREPSIYGHETLAEVLAALRASHPKHTVEELQSNHEGVLIDRLHDLGDCQGVVLNAGALSHTSYSLADAIRAIQVPVVEVHISNIHRRESFRHHSVLSAACEGTISGLGTAGYELALIWLIRAGAPATG
jgi:3-dehydroquinate dehydratase II